MKSLKILGLSVERTPREASYEASRRVAAAAESPGWTVWNVHSRFNGSARVYRTTEGGGIEIYHPHWKECAVVSTTNGTPEQPGHLNHDKGMEVLESLGIVPFVS